jgi:hypothetical protein
MYKQWCEFSFILKPSTRGGVGVFATHPIIAESPIFHRPFTMRILAINEIPPALRQYCIYINEEEAICPEHFAHMEIAWFINHSDQPNIMRRMPIRNFGAANKMDTLNDMKMRSMYSIKNIEMDEEILIDYNHLNEPEHLKEDYYRR